jgi:two-component system KDP operon response regulator KdpE
MFRVLVVEDDGGIRAVLATLLESAGYRVALAENAHRALVEARAGRPDLALVDLGLPDRDGVTVIREIRKFSSLPVIVLSARTQDADKIAALDAGADDYVTKPFSAAELLARVRAGLRRTAAAREDNGEVAIGPVSLDLARRTACGPDGPIHLTPLEFRVLERLVRDRGRVVTQEQLLRDVWGPEREGDSRSLRAYVKLLRQKLEADPGRPRWLLTEVGVGYRLADE